MRIKQCPEHLRVPLQKKLRAFRRMLITIGVFLLVALTVLLFGTMDDVVSGSGTVAGIREYALKSLVSARIVEICHHEGEELSFGDVLVKLDDRDQRARIDQIDRELQELKLQIEVKAKDVALLTRDPLPEYYRHTQKLLQEAREKEQRTRQELEVYRKLYEQKLVTRREFLQTELEEISNRMTVERLEEDWARLQSGMAQEIIARAKSELLLLKQRYANKQAERQYEEKKLEDFVIRAPDDGVVTDIPPRAGGYYETGEVVVQFSANRNKKVVALIDEKQIYKIRPGQPVRISCNQYNYLDFGYFTGVVDVIYQLPEQVGNVNYYPVKIVLDSEHQPLRFGSRCEVDIVTGRERILFALLGLRDAGYLRRRALGAAEKQE